MASSKKSSYQIGQEFEKDFANRIGAKIQPGSGNQWFAKLDVNGRSFLWSLKATTQASFRVTKDMWVETLHAVFGPGGKGGNTIPGMAIRIDDEDYVMLRITDFLQIVQEDIKITAPTKKEEKRKRGKITIFDRMRYEGALDGSQEEY